MRRNVLLSIFSLFLLPMMQTLHGEGEVQKDKNVSDPNAQEIYFKKNPPDYQEMFDKLPLLWQSRYPYPAKSFVMIEKGKGRILSATENGLRFYYYHYLVNIESISKNKTTRERQSEIWIRYRHYAKPAVDFTFARMDRLPGANLRYIE